MDAKDNNEKVIMKPNLGKTIVLSLICVFFTCVAWNWELKNRREFKRVCKFKEMDIPELEMTLKDADDLISCRDPFIEHFCSKHDKFSKLNALWVINSSQYWMDKYKDELKRRG